MHQHIQTRCDTYKLNEWERVCIVETRSNPRKCCILDALERVRSITYKRSETRLKSKNGYMGYAFKLPFLLNKNNGNDSDINLDQSDLFLNTFFYNIVKCKTKRIRQKYTRHVDQRDRRYTLRV